jgi:hypothetical protein
MATRKRSTCENMLTNNIKCHREPRYVIGQRTNAKIGVRDNSTHIWLKVCGTCDRQIGRRNLVKVGWSLPDAIRWERDPDMGNSLERGLFYARQKGRGAPPSGTSRSKETMVVGSN